VHAFNVLSDVREPGVLRRNIKVVEFRKGKPSYTREEKNSGKTDMHAEKRIGMNA
jgi:stalled ribosome alternative rescue factor ArfA